MADFVSAAGLEMAAVRDLPPGTDDTAQLTVSIWLAAKGAAGDALATPSSPKTTQSMKESA